MEGRKEGRSNGGRVVTRNGARCQDEQMAAPSAMPGGDGMDAKGVGREDGSRRSIERPRPTGEESRATATYAPDFKAPHGHATCELFTSSTNTSTPLRVSQGINPSQSPDYPSKLSDAREIRVHKLSVCMERSSLIIRLHGPQSQAQ